MEGILATSVFRMLRKKEKVIFFDFSSGMAGLLCGVIKVGFLLLFMKKTIGLPTNTWYINK